VTEPDFAFSWCVEAEIDYIYRHLLAPDPNLLPGALLQTYSTGGLL
jgi:hypothetical protein